MQTNGTQSQPRKLAWSLADLTKSLGVSRRFLWNEIKAGALRARKLRRRTIVLDVDLQEYLDNAPRVARERK